jgi:hypothetical protein
MCGWIIFSVVFQPHVDDIRLFVYPHQMTICSLFQSHNLAHEVLLFL